ncbi:MAG: SDR family oxidoreductase [Clostridia bacterium]|nr:SDR family oxidoreductase [Clostridia bacterium]
MKTVVITGASRGIGAETARLFSKNGYNVVINYNKSEQAAFKLASELENAVAVKADVSTEGGAKFLIDEALRIFGSVDVLVNNAGVSMKKMLCDTTLDDWKRHFEINVESVFLCSKAASEIMVRNKWGRIINVSSMWGIKGGSCEVCYSAAKAAVIGFTKALARELGPSGITVNAVAPGLIDTDMNADLTNEDKEMIIEETPISRIGTVTDVAAAILYLASDGASFVTAQVISADGGLI